MNRRKWLFFVETLGKICFDLGKLVFGSLVLGVMIRGTIDQSMLFVGGLIRGEGFIPRPLGRKRV
jgi:hypothetical protein